MIAHISDKAQQLVRSEQTNCLSMIDQVVSCVREVLTTVGEADLRVMSRPLASAMRGNSSEEFVEATIQSVRMAP
ncbi:MAG: hypothetical protein HC800_21025, partial [Phormidesmis sp. RL_2_1]|nr:hypothetical protein [Phormidesmis sp. RL_2_1]